MPVNAGGRVGEGKAETFAFLGFTHICGKTNGKFRVLRRTMAQRQNAKLKGLGEEMKVCRHEPIKVQAHGWVLFSGATTVSTVTD